MHFAPVVGRLRAAIARPKSWKLFAWFEGLSILTNSRRCPLVLLTFIPGAWPCLGQPSEEQQQNSAVTESAPQFARVTGVIVAKTVGDPGEYMPLVNALVHVYTKGVNFKAIVPPPEQKPLRLANVGLGFEPRVSILTPGHSVIFASKTSSYRLYTLLDCTEQGIDTIKMPSQSRYWMPFPLSEKSVAALAISGALRFGQVQDESMVGAKIIISPWGLSAVTDKDGTFSIEHVPAGKRDFVI